MEQLKIEYLSVDKIIPYKKNPRKNDGAVDAVANSIKEFGFKNPIIVNKDLVVIAGHTRLKAANKLGLKEVPCVVVKDLTEEQEKALRIADNKTNELAEWDLELLQQEIEDIINIDMTDFGFEEVAPEPTEVIEDNFNVDENVPEQPKSEYGQIYKLGEHRLMCGDSTNAGDVEKLMDGQIADLLFTDPPYNVDVSNSQGMKIENDNMLDEQFRAFLNDAFGCANRSLKPGGAFYVWHGDSETVNFRTTLKENGLTVRQCLIWVKNSFNFGRQDYKWKHEPCLYGWKEGEAHYFVEEYNHPTVIEDELDLDKLKKEEMKEMLKEMLSERVPTTIVHENKPLKNDLHPTMKPLKMCANMIRNSSRTGELVLDLFGGSGSTLITCEQLNRRCYMMEYDPKYVDVIIKRWEEFTGKKAELIK